MSSFQNPALSHCHDGYYLWATQYVSPDDPSVPAYIRLDDGIGMQDGKLVYTGGNAPAPSATSRSSSFSSWNGSPYSTDSLSSPPSSSYSEEGDSYFDSRSGSRSVGGGRGEFSSSSKSGWQVVSVELVAKKGGFSDDVFVLKAVTNRNGEKRESELDLADVLRSDGEGEIVWA